MRLRTSLDSMFSGSPSSGHQPSTPSENTLRCASHKQPACPSSNRSTRHGSCTDPCSLGVQITECSTTRKCSLGNSSTISFGSGNTRGFHANEPLAVFQPEGQKPVPRKITCRRAASSRGRSAPRPGSPRGSPASDATADIQETKEVAFQDPVSRAYSAMIEAGSDAPITNRSNAASGEAGSNRPALPVKSNGPNG